MPNIRLVIAYDGTSFAGWQVQKNAKTIQGILESRLRKILGEKVRVTASGRTDAGVHAKRQVANFKTEKNFPPDRLKTALNARLPEGISVTGIKNAPPDFHSQFDAQTKIYRYAILVSRVDNPFLKRYYHRVPYDLDVSLMKREAGVLLGKHDFRSFQAKSDKSPLKSTVRTIKEIKIVKRAPFVYIDVEADGFLHNMVRNITGTLIEIGRGYLPRGSMRKILSSKNRRKAGPTAPAKGLTLIGVKY